jgi:hypothetical protein
MMSHCLLECNNARRPFSLLYLGVFRIMDNMELLWICISYLCLKRNTSFSSINIIKVISIINKVISINSRTVEVWLLEGSALLAACAEGTGIYSPSSSTPTYSSSLSNMLGSLSGSSSGSSG